jgi:hypothetical protein
VIRPLRTLAAAALAVALSACVVVPRTVYNYDTECRILAKQMTLQPVQIGYIAGCANEACVTLLAVAGVTAAASTVISGTIAVAGNVVYWLERQGNCGRGDAPPLTVPPPLPPVVVPSI